MRRTGKLLWRGYWRAISNARLAKKLCGCRCCPPSLFIYGRSIWLIHTATATTATEAMADGVTAHITDMVFMAGAHTTVPDITVPGIGKRATFQQLSRREGAPLAISL